MLLEEESPEESPFGVTKGYSIRGKWCSCRILDLVEGPKICREVTYQSRKALNDHQNIL